MSSSRSDGSAAPDFHPEFGFLCPSARKRRGVRLATAIVVTALAIGATMGLAVAYHPDVTRPATMAPPIDEPPPAEAAVPAADATRAHESCKGDAAQDLAAFFLSPACRSNKPHARHGARAANHVATVIIGRTEALPTPAAATPAPVAGSGPPQAGGGNAEKQANVAALERTAPPKKLKPKTTASMALAAPAPAVDATMTSAYASAPRSFAPYGDPFRSIAPPGGLVASPGRSWPQWP
jgi:hypothetical protein